MVLTTSACYFLSTILAILLPDTGTTSQYYRVGKIYKNASYRGFALADIPNLYYLQIPSSLLSL